MAACRRIGGGRRGRHVFKYRTGSDSAHRTGSSCQSLLPTHHPTDSTAATDDFHLVHCVHHRHYRSTQRSQHPCMQPDSGHSGDSAQRTRTGPGLWSLLSGRKQAIQTIGHCHRGGHAKFRSGHFTGRHSFCPVSHGGRTRSHVLGMAQLFGQHCGTDFQKTGR